MMSTEKVQISLGILESPEKPLVEPGDQQRLKVAYIMSRFPKLTETFILYEMIAVEKVGAQIEIYPLLRERTESMHPEAISYVEKAHFQPFLSLSILRANLHFLMRKPGKYLSTLWTLLRANWGSLRFFSGAMGIFPKSVLFAYLMSEQKINHVQAHFASHPAAAAFIIHRLTGISYSFTAHGSDLHRDRHMLCEKVAEAEFVVAISKYNRDLILSACQVNDREKVAVIHCGVDTDIFQSRSSRTPYEAGEQPFTILCVGTLHEVKGQIYLIRACRKLKERGIDFLCHFVGDGPDKENLIMVAEDLEISDNVYFNGQQKQAVIARMLQNADALVAPSVPTRDGRREGIPVVLIEAMSSSVPVIASDLSGIPELVIDGQSGLLVPPGDVDALADALERYIREPLLRKHLGYAGRRKVEDEFDLYKNAASLVHLIRSEG